MNCDAHHHILDHHIDNSIFNTYRVEDLDLLEDVEANYINIGLHPLYLPDNIPWCRIRELLAVGEFNIGEVGLDRRGNLDSQEIVFRGFLDLAREFNLSVSIHCVKAWGRLLEIIREYPELKYLFHGYSGSRETLTSLLNYRSWFSFSVRELRRDKLQDVIRAVPLDRILPESDSSDGVQGREILEIGYIKLSKFLSVPREEFNSIILTNFNEFINRR